VTKENMPGTTLFIDPQCDRFRDEDPADMFDWIANRVQVRWYEGRAYQAIEIECKGAYQSMALMLQSLLPEALKKKGMPSSAIPATIVTSHRKIPKEPQVTEKMPDWIRTPLSESLYWQDVPPKLEGRVIVKRWPVQTKSEGGIHLPGVDGRRIMGVAWVLRASGEAHKYLCPGDSIICPETAIANGLHFPSGEGVDLSDYREIFAEDCYHVLPYAKAQEWRQKTASVLVGECDEALPKIRLLADEGDCSQALAWLSKLRGKAETCSDGIVENLKVEETDVLAKAQAHAERKVAEQQKAEEDAKVALTTERQRQADERKAKE